MQKEKKYTQKNSVILSEHSESKDLRIKTACAVQSVRRSFDSFQSLRMTALC